MTKAGRSVLALAEGQAWLVLGQIQRSQHDPLQRAPHIGRRKVFGRESTRIERATLWRQSERNLVVVDVVRQRQSLQVAVLKAVAYRADGFLDQNLNLACVLSRMPY